MFIGVLLFSNTMKNHIKGSRSFGMQIRENTNGQGNPIEQISIECNASTTFLDKIYSPVI